MPKKFLSWINIFESGMSAVEYIFRILSFIFWLGGSGVTTFLSKYSPFYVQYGVLFLIGVFFISLIVFGVFMVLFKFAYKLQKEAEYSQAMAVKSSSINPLKTLFEDKIIRIEDLRLPNIQLHDSKIFKRCKFVGTGGLVISGGIWQSNEIIDCGNMLPIPEKALISGLPVLKNCTVENCEFYRITLLSTSEFIDAFISEAKKRGKS